MLPGDMNYFTQVICTLNSGSNLVKSRDSSDEKIQFATAAQSTICVRIILSTRTAIIYNENRQGQACLINGHNDNAIKVS